VIIVEKSMLDSACKDKNHKVFSSDLRLEIQYEFIDEKTISQSKSNTKNEEPALNFDI